MASHDLYTNSNLPRSTTQPSSKAHLMSQIRRCDARKDKYQVDNKNVVGLCSIAGLEKRDNKLNRRYKRGILGMNLRSVNASTSHPRISPMVQMRGTGKEVQGCS